MLFIKAFRPISTRSEFARASKLARAFQPRLIEPHTVSFRAVSKSSRKLRQTPTSEHPISRSPPRPHPHNRGGSDEFFEPIDPNRRPDNARPLLTPEQLRGFVNSTRFRAVAIATACGLVLFYMVNIETVPVSGRRRFNCYSKESAEDEAELAYKQILSQEMKMGRVLPKSDPRVRRVETVLGRLIEAGGLGTGQSDSKSGVGWEVHVIDDPNQANAFVLPGGKVFVYSGIFPVCRDINGLAAVMGHEIAHNIAQHYAENMSKITLLRPITWLLIYLDFSGLTLGLGHYLGSIMLDLGIMRTSSREQESEADYIGLMLMAQACYNPKEAVELWERMEGLNIATPPEWLSTHPSNANRIQRITQLLPEAEHKYHESGCASVRVYRDALQEVIGRHLLLSW